jgi:hypothetical protein
MSLPPSSDQNPSFGPYVCLVSADSARVHWISPPGVDGSCRLLDDSAGANVKLLPPAAIPIADAVRRTAVLTGLKADQRHRYIVTAGREQVSGSFRTAPAGHPRKPFTFAIVGDVQTYPLRIRSVTEAIARQAPAFLLHAGDFCDDGQDWALWQAEFFGPQQKLLRSTALWPTRGNHEHGAEPFATIFALPPARLWYSFDYDNLHVAVLDQWNVASDRPMEPERLAEMARWLDQDLAAARSHADWLIVVGHDPMFNVAGHGSHWGHEVILPILYRRGVDLVLAGHSHLYERFVPIGPSGAKPIVFLVTGGGGSRGYPAMDCPVLAKTCQAPQHYCLCRIVGDRLELTVKTPDDLVIDEVLLTRTNGRPPQSFLDAAVSPDQAMQLLKVFKNQTVDFATRPQSGRPLPATLRPGWFPLGSRVTLAHDPDSPWALEEVTFEYTGEPVTFTVTPPEGILFGHDLDLSPPLTATISIQYQGRTYSASAVSLALTAESLRRLAPRPEPVAVPAAPAALAVDAGPAAWQDVQFLRLPSTQGLSRNLKLAWNEKGLFGAVVAEQAGIYPDADLPRNGDGLEIDLEADLARRPPTPFRAEPVTLFLAPRTDGAAGPASVQQTPGRELKEPPRTAWTRTPTGYAMFFLIPAQDLSPVPLAAGQTFTLDLVLRHDGLVVEQLADTSAFRAVGNSPIYWGRIVLS